MVGGALVAVGKRVDALPVHLAVTPSALVVVAVAPCIFESALAVGLARHPAPAVHPDAHVFCEAAEVGREGLVRDLREEGRGVVEW